MQSELKWAWSAFFHFFDLEKHEYVREGVPCGMRNFRKVYFAEFSLRNVPQITPQSFFSHFAFRKIQIKSNHQLSVGLGSHLSLELTQ